MMSSASNTTSILDRQAYEGRLLKKITGQMGENMKKVLLIAALLLPVVALAQVGASAPAAYPEPSAPLRGGFFSVMLSSGPLGLLNWSGIFFGVIAALPLGIMSVIHCATTRVQQAPLALKLLFLGLLSLFFLGCAGGAQGTIASFSHMSHSAADTNVLAMNISQALYSLAGAFTAALFYLFLITISVVTLHFKHKQLLS